MYTGQYSFDYVPGIKAAEQSVKVRSSLRGAAGAGEGHEEPVRQGSWWRNSRKVIHPPPTRTISALFSRRTRNSFLCFPNYEIIKVS